MPIEWLITLIVAIAPHWAPGDCAEDNTACLERNEAQNAKVRALAEAVNNSVIREELEDPVLVLAIIYAESSFQIEPCERLVPLDRIVSRTPIDDPRRPGAERIRWRRGSSRTGTADAERDAINVSEVDGKLNFWVCSFGELGLMQLHPQSRWVRSGTPIPGTDLILPSNRRERMRLVMQPEYNVALGCQELADHRKNYFDAHPDKENATWLDWIGRYNSGSDGNTQYQRNIARRYASLCSIEVSVEEEGETRVAELRTVWPMCEAVDRFLAE